MPGPHSFAEAGPCFFSLCEMVRFDSIFLTRFGPQDKCQGTTLAFEHEMSSSESSAAKSCGKAHQQTLPCAAGPSVAQAERVKKHQTTRYLFPPFATTAKDRAPGKTRMFRWGNGSMPGRELFVFTAPKENVFESWKSGDVAIRCKLVMRQVAASLRSGPAEWRDEAPFPDRHKGELCYNKAPHIRIPFRCKDQRGDRFGNRFPVNKQRCFRNNG